MSVIASDKKIIVLGLGKTGFSVAEFLHGRGRSFLVMDTRSEPPYLEQLKRISVDIPFKSGPFDKNLLADASEIVVSPGLAIEQPEIQYAVERGVSLLGDIDLFLREISAPVVAITGSNGKSTVTTLVGEMAISAGLSVGIGGNLGLPVLEFLKKPEADLYVLELSSFQLETCSELHHHIATVLNVTEDHMDRYSDFNAYRQAKHRIFKGCKAVVQHAEDPLTKPLVPEGVKVINYGFGSQDLKKVSATEVNEEITLNWEFEPLCKASELKVRGKHNLLNALSSLALGIHAGLPLKVMVSALKNYKGLEHRCEFVKSIGGIDFINDSKGTNIGATIAALEGLYRDSGKIVLIAGGVGKGADFSQLKPAVQKYCRAVVLIGESREEMLGALEPEANLALEDSLESAVMSAKQKAEPGDTILLSPACASFDMFKGFEERGNCFKDIVGELS